MFQLILNILLIVSSIALIILSLLQSGKSDGIINALTGQSSTLFAQQKERGVDLILTRLTAAFAILFFVTAIMLRMK